MIVLSIETSTTCGSIALRRDGDCIFAQNFTSERSHNSQIFAPLGEALELATPTLVVVGTGPGSYTGARIGIAAGIGISLTHGARLIGLPSVIAAQGISSYHLVGDARRRRYFFAEVAERQLVAPPELIDRETLDRRLAGDDHRWISFDADPPAPGIGTSRPDAGVLAELAAALSEPEIETLNSTPVVPHYMSAPFVTKAKKRV